jgi:CRISPR-associated protein Cas5d
MKVERVSYDVMTPSAARGVLEAVLWKPAIRWEVTRIDVLEPIRFTSVRRNEVGAVVPLRSVTAAADGGPTLALYVEDERQQRAGVILRDVAYAIHARFRMTGRAGPGDNAAKFREMFARRVEKGQCMMQPYLGCREFSAYFGPVDDAAPPEPIAEDRELGWMLHDLEYRAGRADPRFFDARLEQGILRVPPFAPEVAR